MWDDGSGASGRGRADRDDHGDDRGYGHGYPPSRPPHDPYDPYARPSGYATETIGGPARGDLVEYDIPTTFLPVQRDLTRPRRKQRKRRPVLTVLLVTVATVSLGGGAGLLMARALDSGSGRPGGSVAAAETTTDPGDPSSAPVTAVSPSAVTVTPSVSPTAPSPRPTSATTKASRSAPTRSTKPTSTAKKTATAKPTASAAASKAPTGNAALEAQVLTIVNQERAKAGCKPLRSNSKLVLAARRHSQYMADTGKHGHEGIGDGTPQDRIDKAGYAWRGWGENIAWGYRDAASVMNGWMNSTGHRANILNCSYIDIGVGVDRAGENWTQVFGIPA